jgi:arylsulfatase A-like enzyme
MSIYEEVMRIPLVVRVPHTAHGKVLHEQVSMVDVLPTLLESLGLPPLSRAQGRSLLPLFEGGHLPDSTVFGDASIVSGRRAVRRPTWKYINTPGAGGEELYDLAADPHERTNLCARERDRCEPFLDELMRWEDAQQRKVAELGLPRVATAAVDENVRERLRQSGNAR